MRESIGSSCRHGCGASTFRLDDAVPRREQSFKPFSLRFHNDRFFSQIPNKLRINESKREKESKTNKKIHHDIDSIHRLIRINLLAIVVRNTRLCAVADASNGVVVVAHILGTDHVVLSSQGDSGYSRTVCCS